MTLQAPANSSRCSRGFCVSHGRPGTENKRAIKVAITSISLWEGSVKISYTKKTQPILLPNIRSKTFSFSHDFKLRDGGCLQMAETIHDPPSLSVKSSFGWRQRPFERQGLCGFNYLFQPLLQRLIAQPFPHRKDDETTDYQ